ncbi:reverse transcriptase family protein [Sandaracinus amylolyticus]|uniref:RNA-directed DNA polymerase n=1 Tax=Sandaracinus amylolyticus TaxID=927083 RepID=A0A0F6W8S6_9BACT|nr:reverse transcriptase family protein [Sandaracinus amylolyticus]AKF10381.1 Retron-type RNA-directed DNA polymerase [Sandaracinus amylolyticus]
MTEWTFDADDLDEDEEDADPPPGPAELRLARALALAFLGTDGRRRAMIEAALATLHVPDEARARAWIGALVALVRRTFDPLRRASLDELTTTIAHGRALARRDRGVHVVRWVATPGEMRAPRWDVPRIDTVGDLARWLDVEIGELDWLADRRAMLVRARVGPLHHYVRTWVPKPSGGARLIEAPKARLAAIQRRVLREVLERVPMHDVAHGFRRGRSVATFVAPHVGRAVVVRVDLEDFFASVTRGRVIGIFRSAGYPEEIARTLAALCTTRTPASEMRGIEHAVRARLRVPHLPQGAPTSPALASLAAFRLDARIEGLARAVGARCTRYADDVALSFERDRSHGAIDRVIARIAEIAREEGFGVASHKTRVMRRGARQSLAGVVVNERPAVAREEYERLRAILHRAATRGPSPDELGAHRDLRAHLAGRIAWIAQWSERRGAKLAAMLARIDWSA